MIGYERFSDKVMLRAYVEFVMEAQEKYDFSLDELREIIREPNLIESFRKFLAAVEESNHSQNGESKHDAS